MPLSSKQWLGSILGLGSLLSLGSHVVMPHDVLAHPIGIPSGQTLFTIPESAQASQPTLIAQAIGVSGVWDTSEGQMTIQQQGSSVTATYTQDNGRIEGTLIGNVWEGFWSEDGSAQRCDTPINGRYHWGRIRFVFDGNAFQGTWSYCGEEPTRSWTGTRSGSGEAIRIPPVFNPPPNPSVTPINPPVVVAPPVTSIGGGWDTSEGQMTFQQQGSSVTATYTQDNGRIEGTMTGNVLEGFWSEDGSNRRCDTAINGRYHWGRIRFVFDGNSFQGTWSYCNDEPTLSWTGTRFSGDGSVVTPIAPAPSAAIAGAWNTSEGIMPLTLNGSTVTGYYSNDTQRIDGTLVGNTLDGYWSKNNSARSCDTLYNGRDHWGRIRFVFNGNSFTGVWGYCGEEPTRSWTGSR
ncbi:MAG: hypothetical protein HC924_10360 [Synechococcaceae cyanobacterium SM2_3_2]|nr:hypothetical protein [Synechococcaceae cyanobacterium SM2_3_2]